MAWPTTASASPPIDRTSPALNVIPVLLGARPSRRCRCCTINGQIQGISLGRLWISPILSPLSPQLKNCGDTWKPLFMRCPRCPRCPRTKKRWARFAACCGPQNVPPLCGKNAGNDLEYLTVLNATGIREKEKPARQRPCAFRFALPPAPTRTSADCQSCGSRVRTFSNESRGPENDPQEKRKFFVRFQKSVSLRPGYVPPFPSRCAPAGRCM